MRVCQGILFSLFFLSVAVADTVAQPHSSLLFLAGCREQEQLAEYGPPYQVGIEGPTFLEVRNSCPKDRPLLLQDSFELFPRIDRVTGGGCRVEGEGISECQEEHFVYGPSTYGKVVANVSDLLKLSGKGGATPVLPTGHRVRAELDVGGILKDPLANSKSRKLVMVLRSQIVCCALR